MATVQCANNHVYDDSKYHICPYCPVPGLKDANIPGTQAAPLSKPARGDGDGGGDPDDDPAHAVRV